jgi:hypothetical protein
VRAAERFLAADKKADRRGLVVVLLEGPGSVRLVRASAAGVAAALVEALARYN